MKAASGNRRNSHLPRYRVTLLEISRIGSPLRSYYLLPAESDADIYNTLRWQLGHEDCARPSVVQLVHSWTFFFCRSHSISTPNIKEAVVVQEQPALFICSTEMFLQVSSTRRGVSHLLGKGNDS